MTYVLKKKSDDLLMRFIGFFISGFMALYVTTYRLPFMHRARVCVPSSWEKIPEEVRMHIIDHEVHHVRQFAPWYGPWWVIAAQVLPLPVFFSGRWFVERRAFLDDIERGVITLERAVDVLDKAYGHPWPRDRMTLWFLRRLPVTQDPNLDSTKIS